MSRDVIPCRSLLFCSAAKLALFQEKFLIYWYVQHFVQIITNIIKDDYTHRFVGEFLPPNFLKLKGKGDMRTLK